MVKWELPQDMWGFQRARKIIYAENWMRAIADVLNMSYHRPHGNSREVNWKDKANK